MPWGLKRYQQTRQLHFVTFSCYHRAPLLGTPQARDLFVLTLEKVRCWYGFWLVGYEQLGIYPTVRRRELA
jgi:putative transposase